MFLDLENNRETVRNEFDLFGRLNVPVGEYEFNRVRAEIATGMQRPVRVVLSVEDGGFFVFDGPLVALEDEANNAVGDLRSDALDHVLGPTLRTYGHLRG